MTSKLLSCHFGRCTTANHRSYIVNMDRVKEIERMRIVIDANVRIAIGENYKADFQEYLRRHSLS